MRSLPSLKASGVVAEDFEVERNGGCCRSWCIRTASVEYAEARTSGRAVEVDGELCVQGVRTYAFHAAEASFEKLEKPYPGVRVSASGKLHVEDLGRGLRFSCGQFTWLPGLQSLSLGGNVTTVIPDELELTCPKLNLSGSERFGTLEETVAYVSDHRRVGGLETASVGNSALFHGPCQGWVKVPAASFKDLSLACPELAAGKQQVRKDNPGLKDSVGVPENLGIAFSAQGMLFDMEHQAVMAQGPLKISCRLKGLEISAGTGDILLSEGILALHEGVSVTLQERKLKTPRLTWYFGRVGKSHGNIFPQGSKRGIWRSHMSQESRNLAVGKRNAQPPATLNGAKEDIVARFTAMVGGMHTSGPCLGKQVKIMPFCRCTRRFSAGDISAPKLLVSGPGKREILWAVARNLCTRAVSVDSSGIHVHLSQLLQERLDFALMDVAAPVPVSRSDTASSQVRERNAYPLLAAREEQGMACGTDTKNVVLAEGPIGLVLAKPSQVGERRARTSNTQRR